MKNTVLILLIFLSIIFSAEAVGKLCQPKFIYFPHSYDKWDYRFNIGLSISRLPTEIVEEEINTSPMVLFDFRLGLPYNLSTTLLFNSNYMANHGSLGLQWTLINP